MSSAIPATGRPSDVVAYFAQLDDADRRARALISGLTEAQANWQPGAGAAWSVAQCLDHMAITTVSYLAALRGASARAREGHRPIKPAGWFSSWFLSKTEPPVSLKIKAPRNIRPASNIPTNEALAHFLAANGKVRQFVDETAHLDLCGTRFRNPFVPILRFTIATGLLVISGHNRRHLWQAEAITKLAGFPES